MSCSSCWPPAPAIRPTPRRPADQDPQNCEPLRPRLEQGRDRLLEIHSSGGSGAAQQLVDKLAAEDDDTGADLLRPQDVRRIGVIRMTVVMKMRWC